MIVRRKAEEQTLIFQNGCYFKGLPVSPTCTGKACRGIHRSLPSLLPSGQGSNKNFGGRPHIALRPHHTRRSAPHPKRSFRSKADPPDQNQAIVASGGQKERSGDLSKPLCRSTGDRLLATEFSFATPAWTFGASVVPCDTWLACFWWRRPAASPSRTP
jgi:hypothetical protein